MSIMDKFFGAGARHATNPNQGAPSVLPTQGNIPMNTGMPQNGTPGVAPNGVTPTAPADSQQATEQNKSPFEEFHKLWEPNTGPDGKPVTVTEEPLYNVDPKTVMEAAQRTDFKSVATKEQLSAVAAGGEAGVAAMMDILQNMSASVYANAAVAATKIAEQGIHKALSQAERRLPTAIRNQQLGESLAANNPALKDPAVAPLVELTRNQFAQKFPNASASELETMTMSYMAKVGMAFNPEKPDPNANNRTDRNSQPWDVYFNDAGVHF